jgi:transcriptional regulator with XRE-family HTH domain
VLEAKLLFGKRIKELRRERKFTQAQLAERVELSINYISQIETGEASHTFVQLSSWVTV